MTDRTVKVSLILQATGYMSGIQQVAAKTREAGTEIDKLGQTKQAFETVGRASLAAGVAVGVGLGMAVSKFVEFDQQMSYVQAATHETAANMGLLRDAALDAGARTVFSATEAAAAIEELSKAGVSTRDILAGGLDAALDLAAAGGLGVADAAGIASVALKTFNLRGEDMSHVADLLAAGAGKAMGDVSDLSAALAQGGQVAKQTGLSIEETTAGLAAFASQGLLGSDAGTSFKSMLQRLTPQSAEARDKMRELGISAYDASGQFVGLAEFAGNLQQSLQLLTPEQRNSALATIFGSDAVRAANVLYSEGEQGIQKWIHAVDDQGYAAETAAIRLDNLKGDWEALTGAIDTAAINTGEAANGPLRLGVQILTDWVDTFNSLPEGGQQAVFWIGAVGGAAAIAAGSFLVAVPKVAEYRVAIDTLGSTAQRTSRTLATIGRVAGVAAAAAAIGSVANALIEQMLPSLDETTAKLDSATTGVDALYAGFSRMSLIGIQLDQLAPKFKTLGEDLDNMQGASGFFSWATRAIPTSITAVQGLSDSFATLAERDLPAAAAQFRAIADEYDLTNQQQIYLINTMSSYREALVRIADDRGVAITDENLLAIALDGTGAAAKAAANQADANARSLDGLSGQAEITGVDIEALADTIRGFGAAQLDTRSAARQFEAALDELQASIDEHGATLDRTTEAGRANEESLDELAKSTLELAAATITQTGNQTDANNVIADGRNRLIEMLSQFGITGQAAQDYADDLGLIPGQVATALNLNADEAMQKAQAFAQLLRDVPNSKTVRLYIEEQGRLSGADRGQLGAAYNFAGGMYERGKPKEFYAGGFASGIYRGSESGIHKFAEERLPWETYISPDPAYRRENQNLVLETGRRLGMWESAPYSAGSGERSISVSLEGASITGRLRLDGDGLATLIDGRIDLAARNENARWAGGEKSL